LGKILEILGKIPENPNKTLNHLGKIPENLGQNGAQRLQKNKRRPSFWRSHQKRSTKVERQLFGQVWENLGKNPLHPQKFACSYTYDLTVLIFVIIYINEYRRLFWSVWIIYILFAEKFD